VLFGHISQFATNRTGPRIPGGCRLQSRLPPLGERRRVAQTSFGEYAPRTVPFPARRFATSKLITTRRRSLGLRDSPMRVRIAGCHVRPIVASAWGAKHGRAPTFGVGGMDVDRAGRAHAGKRDPLKKGISRQVVPATFRRCPKLAFVCTRELTAARRHIRIASAEPCGLGPASTRRDCHAA